MKYIVSVIFLTLTFLFSCKTHTVYVPIENEKVKKEYIDRWHRDSVYLKDSIYLERKGDTVWIEKYKTFYREKLVRDSILVVDSVRVEIPYAVIETKEVNRLRAWQIALMCLGGVMIGSLGFRVFKIFR